MRKHSYRTLDKRRWAAQVYNYLNDKESALSIFELDGLRKEERDYYKSAYEKAEQMIKDTRKGRPVNLFRYAPYKSQIKNLLKNYLT